MATHEDQNYYERTNWQAHLARERIDLSKSVEQSLADDAMYDPWSENDLPYNAVDPTQSRADLVPPKISLQSKVQPSVRPDGFARTATSEMSARQNNGKEPEKTQGRGFLSRFAQRFTSSIAAIMQPDTLEWEPSAANSTQSESSYNQTEWNEPTRNTYTQGEVHQSTSEQRRLTPLPTSYQLRPDNATRVIDAIPAPSASTSATLPTMKSKQRLAGHTGKVRLQTTELPQVQPKPFTTDSDVYAWHHDTKEPIREPLTVNVRVREKHNETAMPQSSVNQLVTDMPQSSVNQLVTDMPETDKSYANTVTKPAHMYLGSGIFERGQSDLMVKNEHATDTGVVHITFTTNPGRSQLQYVSLHAALGFTVHLSATIQARTSFNYVLFEEHTDPDRYK